MPFTSAVRAFHGEPGALSSFPQKKIKFGIDGNAISRCIEGLEFETVCTVESPLSHLHYF